jgi:hypothetical protein
MFSLRREDAAMPGDDPVVAVEQDRVGEPELADAAGDLGDLRLGMRPRVPGIIVQHGRERRIGVRLRLAIAEPSEHPHLARLGNRVRRRIRHVFGIGPPRLLIPRMLKRSSMA